MAELSVELTAKIDKFTKDLKKGEKALEDFGKTADGVSKKSVKSEESLGDLADQFLGTAVGTTTLVAGLGILGLELFRVATASTGAQLAQESLTLAMGKATASTSAEITKLGVLVEIAKDENLGRERRNRAVNELQKTYPEYLKNINLENIGTKETTDQLGLLSDALVRNAQIKAISGQIAKQQTIIYQQEAKSWWDRFDAADAFFEILRNGTGGVIGTGGVAGLITSINKESTNAQIVLAKLNEELRNLLLIDNKAGKGTGGQVAATRGPNQRQSSTTSFFANVPELDTTLVPPSTIPNFAEKLSELELVWLDFSNRMQPLVNSGIADSFGNIGAEIGSAIANGTSVIDAAGAGLLGSIGNIMVQLGQQAIAVGVGLLAIKIAFKTLGGFGAIAAGTALVALGSSFQTKAQGLSSQFGATGNVSSGGSSSFSGSGSSSTFSGSSGGYGEVVFRISGQELVGVLSRVQSKNTRYGRLDG